MAEPQAEYSGVQGRHCVLSPRSCSVGGRYIAMDGRDDKGGQGRWELGWISHSLSQWICCWDEEGITLQIKPQSRKGLSTRLTSTK